MNSIPQNRHDFEQLFRQYYSALYWIARGYIRSKPVTEEIVNDVFVKFWIYREQIRIHASVKDYLFRSVRNACIDCLRSEQKTRQQTAYFSDSEAVSSALADLGKNPFDYVVSSEMQGHIQKIIDELPPRYRMTFELTRMDDMSYEAAANSMGVTKNTVKSNLRGSFSHTDRKTERFIFRRPPFLIKISSSRI
jgi:RNA polymerase sigma-70 factor (ECF subfamily)